MSKTLKKNNYIKESSGPEKNDGTVYYRASLTKNGKHISLGSFSDALQAHRAYEQGLLLLVRSFPDTAVLREGVPFVLRKMGQSESICGATDIYIGNRLLSGASSSSIFIVPHHVLKFDMEDLFYYFFP